MKLKDETYDLLKTIAIYIIPSVETCWLTLAAVWNLPYGQRRYKMDIKEYIVVTVMAAVWLILQIAKPLISENLRKYIPLFAAILGIVFTCWINMQFTFELFLQGMASGFAATGLNEGVNAVFFNNEED